MEQRVEGSDLHRIWKMPWLRLELRNAVKSAGSSPAFMYGNGPSSYKLMEC